MITTTVVLLMAAISGGGLLGVALSRFLIWWDSRYTDFPDMDLQVRPVEPGSAELETFSGPSWEQLEIDLNTKGEK